MSQSTRSTTKPSHCVVNNHRFFALSTGVALYLYHCLLTAHDHAPNQEQTNAKHLNAANPNNETEDHTASEDSGLTLSHENLITENNASPNEKDLTTLTDEKNEHLPNQHIHTKTTAIFTSHNQTDTSTASESSTVSWPVITISILGLVGSAIGLSGEENTHEKTDHTINDLTANEAKKNENDSTADSNAVALTTLKSLKPNIDDNYTTKQTKNNDFNALYDQALAKLATFNQKISHISNQLDSTTQGTLGYYINQSDITITTYLGEMETFVSTLNVTFNSLKAQIQNTVDDLSNASSMISSNLETILSNQNMAENSTSTIISQNTSTLTEYHSLIVDNSQGIINNHGTIKKYNDEINNNQQSISENISNINSGLGANNPQPNKINIKVIDNFFSSIASNTENIKQELHDKKKTMDDIEQALKLTDFVDLNEAFSTLHNNNETLVSINQCLNGNGHCNVNSPSSSTSLSLQNTANFNQKTITPNIMQPDKNTIQDKPLLPDQTNKAADTVPALKQSLKKTDNIMETISAIRKSIETVDSLENWLTASYQLLYDNYCSIDYTSQYNHLQCTYNNSQLYKIIEHPYQAVGQLQTLLKDLLDAVNTLYNSDDATNSLFEIIKKLPASTQIQENTENINENTLTINNYQCYIEKNYGGQVKCTDKTDGQLEKINGNINITSNLNNMDIQHKALLNNTDILKTMIIDINSSLNKPVFQTSNADCTPNKHNQIDTCFDEQAFGTAIGLINSNEHYIQANLSDIINQALQKFEPSFADSSSNIDITLFQEAVQQAYVDRYGVDSNTDILGEVDAINGIILLQKDLDHLLSIPEEGE